MSETDLEISRRIRERMKKFDETFNSWITDQTDEISALYHSHAGNMQTAREEINGLEKEAKQEQVAIEEQQLKFQEQQQELQRLEQELKALNESQSALPSRIAELKERQNELMSILRRKQLELEDASGAFESRLRAVKTEIALYKDVLGLTIEVDGGMLKFTMRDVDPRHPNAELSFYLIINEDNQYSILSCRPQLPTLEGLTAELRSTGDLTYFIHSIRRAFRIYVQTNA